MKSPDASCGYFPKIHGVANYFDGFGRETFRQQEPAHEFDWGRVEAGCRFGDPRIELLRERLAATQLVGGFGPHRG